ncbi:MAG: membrane protein insertase YidC [Cytophagales bacterium]|nr:membrane protein insertase YidC [Cytophagales bacterium]
MNNSVERNQAIGVVIITGLILAYFTFFSNTSDDKKQVANPIKKTIIANNFQNQPDSSLQTMRAADTSQIPVSEQITTVENKNLVLRFSNKGALLTDVKLKNFKSYYKDTVSLISQDYNKYTQSLATASGKILLSDLYYNISKSQTADTTIVKYETILPTNQKLAYTYIIPPVGYTIKYKIDIESNKNSDYELTLIWNHILKRIEKDLQATRNTSTITYRQTDGTYSSLSENSTDVQEKTVNNLNWLAYKQKFFTTGIISDGNISAATIKSEPETSDSTVIKTFASTITLSQKDMSSKPTFTLFFGPNKLSVVRPVATDFVENVYLGWPVINTINRYTIAPLFAFLEKFMSNYGIIIILMVLIIKIVLFPLSFKAYQSMAKIKVLKPELDEIKAKAGDDMGLMQQEQMKLYNQVGVNPISGCIPVLLQMPVLLAMFNFFPNAIELRQQSFLWAEDLSSYDSIASLPFSIPFYGDHVSLFALLMTASTLLYTWYNSQMNVSSITGPMMAMQYIMPLVFMFVMNTMPAGLSFYYFVSNMVTIGQQYIIKLFVDEKAIRAKLEDNKKTATTRKPNRFQQRLMEAMEQQQELKKKSGKGKK